MNSINKKNILIALVVIMVGLLIVGGTYAYLTVAMSVTNGNYVTNTHCFGVTYSGDTDSISGTLFPSRNASGGLSGGISATADATCGLNGRGTLYLHIDNSTSNQLLSTVFGHCEVENTLETLQEYDSSAECTNVSGAKWVTNGTALKYAVFSGSDLYSSGYITASDKGTDKVIHEDFSVTTTTKTFDVYVWLDGYLSDDSYLDLPFNGSTKMVVMQTKSTDTTFTGDTPLLSGYLDQIKYSQMDFFYQRVEYIRSSGTQYIDTGFTPNQDTSVELHFNGLVSTGYQDYFGTSTSSNGYSYGFYDGGSKAFDNYYDDKQIRSGHISGIMTVKKNKNVTTVTGSYNLNLTHTPDTFTSGHSLYLFARWKTTGAYRPATMDCYSFKIWDDDTLVRDFVPVYRKSDSKPGLYDAIGGKFYINQATSGDDFTVGPDVS